MRIQLLLAGLLSVGAMVQAADRVPAAGGDIEITPVLHSSVQIEHAGKVIQVDPWSAADLSTLKPADLILVTDDPIHHLDPAAIARLRKPGAPVVMPASGKAKIPDGIVLSNGERTVAAGIPVESVAAYDIKPGAPEHPKGVANGYVIVLGGKRILLAAVTECVPEVAGQKDIEVAFLPMNIPPNRMMPAEVAACVKRFNPKIVYLTHYDNGSANRLTNPTAKPPTLPGGLTVAQSLEAFAAAVKDGPTTFRMGNWYPAN